MIASKLDKLDLSGNQPVITDPSWEDCVDGFKQADVDMGSAFHLKLDWMNKAADIYLQDNNKMAGFVDKFAEDCDISYRYALSINGKRKTFLHRDVENFSHNALDILSYIPEELRKDIVSSDKPMTAPEVQQAKKGYKAVQEDESNADLKEKVESKEIKPVDAAKIANKRAEDAVLEFNSLSNEQKIAHLGIPKIVDQKKLDETLEEDFNPINAATGILISLNRLRIFGGRKEIERNILGVLNNTVRMQSYEAEALILLADIVNENREEIKSMYETKRNLQTIN
jgi:hypothetical protein